MKGEGKILCGICIDLMGLSAARGGPETFKSGPFVLRSVALSQQRCTQKDSETLKGSMQLCTGKGKFSEKRWHLSWVLQYELAFHCVEKGRKGTPGKATASGIKQSLKE